MRTNLWCEAVRFSDEPGFSKSRQNIAATHDVPVRIAILTIDVTITNNAHCGTLASLISIRPSIEGFGSTFQGLELRRPGGMDAARLGKEIAR